MMMSKAILLSAVLFIGCMKSNSDFNNKQHEVIDSKEEISQVKEIGINEVPGFDTLEVIKFQNNCGFMKNSFVVIFNKVTRRKSFLLVTDKNHSEIDIPNFINGFAINNIRTISEGFEVSLEYGSQIHHDKVFTFLCENGKYFLTEIRDSFFERIDDGYDEKTTINSFDSPVEFKNVKLIEYLK